MNRDLTAYYKLCDIIDFAPEAPAAKAMGFARQVATLEIKEYYARCALALLAEALGFDDNGNIPEALSNRYKDDRAMQWALKQVMAAHGWVVCGPIEHPMNKLKESIVKEATDGDH